MCLFLINPRERRLYHLLVSGILLFLSQLLRDFTAKILRSFAAISFLPQEDHWEFFRFFLRFFILSCWFQWVFKFLQRFWWRFDWGPVYEFQLLRQFFCYRTRLLGLIPLKLVWRVQWNIFKIGELIARTSFELRIEFLPCLHF